MICWWPVSCKTPSLGWTESCAAYARHKRSVPRRGIFQLLLWN
jgi:squalene cyclase